MSERLAEAELARIEAAARAGADGMEPESIECGQIVRLVAEVRRLRALIEMGSQADIEAEAQAIVEEAP